MSNDIVRLNDFGKDLGLVHEMIVTGRKVGAGTEFYSALTHDEDLFRRVVEMVLGKPKGEPLPQILQVTPEQEAAMQALMAAVQKGVKCENGVYRFFDPGIPLTMLRNLSIIREQKLIFSHDWYDGYSWATREDAPQERILRIPVEGSFNKNFRDQEKLIATNEEVASARSVVIFLVINALATGTRLLPVCWVRCIDKGSVGLRVYVGDFDATGLCVYSFWGGICVPSVGLAASRKS